MTRADELRKMVAEATPGPWVSRDDRTIVANGIPLARLYADRNDVANARLIAQAPTLATDLAAALEEIERLRAGLDSAFLAIVEARAHADPGPLFRALNEILGKVDDIRRAALQGDPT